MTTKPFCHKLAAAVADADQNDRLQVLARELAFFFGVQDHEIGLFKLDSVERCATFVWPPHRLLQEVKIPIKSFAASLVSATAKHREGTIDNLFASSSHLKMFELSLADREQCLPLQKIMAAPCEEDGKLRWIVQVSRKGRTLAEVGPDFKTEELDKLMEISKVIATLPI